jgi:hypothetical protein
VAPPQIGEQRIVVVGLLLGAKLGFGGGGFLLGLGGNGLQRIARCLAVAPFPRPLHTGFSLGAQAIDCGTRAFHCCGCSMVLGLRARHLFQQRLAAFGGGGNAQTVVLEDLCGAALASIEVADQPAGRHLVELDAGQLAQGLAALLAQAVGIIDGRAQSLIELPLLAVQLGDGVLDR